MQNQIVIYLEKVIYVKNVDVTSVKANNGLKSQSVKNGAVSKKLFKKDDDDNDQTEQKAFLYEHQGWVGSKPDPIIFLENSSQPIVIFS